MNRDLELLIAFLRPIQALLVDDSVTEIDQYAAFTKGSADDVVEAALSYVFDKDKAFQKFRDESTGANRPSRYG